MRGLEVADISYPPERIRINENRKRDNGELTYTTSLQMRKSRIQEATHNTPTTDRGNSRGSETNTHQLKGIGSIRQLM